LSGSTSAILDPPVLVDQPLKKAIYSLCHMLGPACHPFHDAIATLPAIQSMMQIAVAQRLSIAFLNHSCFRQPGAVTFEESRLLASVEAA